MDKVRTDILQQLQNLEGAPSVQFQEVPPAFMTTMEKGGDDGGKGDDFREGREVGGEVGSEMKRHEQDIGVD